jgi:hypothetical protein
MPNPLMPKSASIRPAPAASASLAAALAAALALALAASASAYDPQAPLNAPERFGVGVKYTGITYHPDGGEHEGYPRKLDDAAYWVLLLGAQMDADWRPYRYLYVRGATSLYRDCADLWAGYFHLGFRANYDIGERVAVRVGIGPTYLWRQNWLHRVEGYTRDSFFGDSTRGDFQHAFIWYGGDAEIEWKANDHFALAYSVIPGWPEVIQSSVGFRYTF